ncbi:hypothetical protein AND_006661 [Anopheles darlingi]|uniref:Uncharacterized protein n=1 Tax=Anopheles darlingi TaxID=43151 RepID=W5JB41_ANODA|nr:hypothetical protein AND_006661 [Anopheles darlingi]
MASAPPYGARSRYNASPSSSHPLQPNLNCGSSSATPQHSLNPLQAAQQQQLPSIVLARPRKHNLAG